METWLKIPVGDMRDELDTWSAQGHDLLKRPMRTQAEFEIANIHRANWYRDVVRFLQIRFTSSDVANRFKEGVSTSISHKSALWQRRAQDYVRQVFEMETALTGIRNALALYERKDNVDAVAAGETKQQAKDIFIVHGHDDGATHAVKRFCDKILVEGVAKILAEQPQRGRTMIEKFEQESGTARYAIVTYTPDDVGAAKTDPDNERDRARQNVIFELGYFVGKLGRGNVCLLYKRPAEIPSDFQGVGYVELDNHEGWHNRLIRELQAANVPVTTGGIFL